MHPSAQPSVCTPGGPQGRERLHAHRAPDRHRDPRRPRRRSWSSPSAASPTAARWPPARPTSKTVETAVEAYYAKTAATRPPWPRWSRLPARRTRAAAVGAEVSVITYGSPPVRSPPSLSCADPLRSQEEGRRWARRPSAPATPTEDTHAQVPAPHRQPDRPAARRPMAGRRHRPAAHRGHAADARVHGELAPVAGHRVLTAADTDSLLAELLTPEQQRGRDAAPRVRLLVQLARPGPDPRQRVQPARATAVALRMIPREIPTIDELGLPPVMRDLHPQHQGLILVTGPTGSGKSTTLAAHDRPDQHASGPATSSPSRTRSSTCTSTSAPRSTSARSARTPQSFADALRVGAAGGPRRAAGRRDARPGVDPVRAHHRRDRPPRASPRCTPTTPPSRSPASSTSSRPSSRPRCASSSPPR